MTENVILENGRRIFIQTSNPEATEEYEVRFLCSIRFDIQSNYHLNHHIQIKIGVKWKSPLRQC